MSMLAERRRKQKWSLNPRGKEWSSDSNKFGQKLLEKMGWSAGKGLGAKEDGITEHIKVSYKNDSKGMGFKESDSQWTEHESNFSELLNSLTGPNSVNLPKTENEMKPESLEEKSQKSRARVHYHKFTRGKDLSRYSEKDLANIFGRKNLNKIEPDKNDIAKNTESDNKSYGVETLNGGSMLEYFKKKMPNYKKYHVNKSESEDERPSFGFGFNSDKQQNSTLATFVSYVEPSQHTAKENGDANDTEIETKGMKRRSTDELELAFTPLKKKSKKFESLDSLDDNESFAHTPKKKKNKSKKGKIESLDVGLENPAFDPMFTSVKIDSRPLEVIEELDESVLDDSVGNAFEHRETREFKKNSKKEKIKEETNSKSSDNGNPCEAMRDIKSKKLKKEKTKTDEVCEAETIPLEIPETLPLKKSKKMKASHEGTENSGFVDFEEETNEKIDKKSKKRKSKNNGGIVNSCFEDLTETSLYSENSFTENKKKKVTFSEVNEFRSDSDPEVTKCDSASSTKKLKKRKHVDGIENVCFEDLQDESLVEMNEILKSSPNKMSKKSKKDKKSNVGVENHAFEENLDAFPVQDNCEEYEVKRKSKKRKHDETGINNPCFEDNNHEDKRIKTVEDPNLSMPEEDNLVLNVCSTPNKNKDSGMETNSDNAKRGKKDKHSARNVQAISKQLDDCQASVENDINQARECFIGEPVESDGEDSVLPNGEVKLKLKNAKFGRVPKWMQKNKDPSNPKSSYRHLIKGDVVLGFKNTNLHEIKGYDPSKQYKAKV